MTQAVTEAQLGQVPCHTWLVRACGHMCACVWEVNPVPMSAEKECGADPKRGGVPTHISVEPGGALRSAQVGLGVRGQVLGRSSVEPQAERPAWAPWVGACPSA